MRAISGIRSLSRGSITFDRQDITKPMAYKHRAYILETGEIVKPGPGPELLADPSIKEAYLGVS